jgi:hypothetical protein
MNDEIFRSATEILFDDSLILSERRRSKDSPISSMAKINRGSRTVFSCDLYVGYEKAEHSFAHIHVMRGNTKVAVFDFSGRVMSKNKHTSEELVHTLGQWIGDHHGEIIWVWREFLDQVVHRKDGKKH